MRALLLKNRESYCFVLRKVYQADVATCRSKSQAAAKKFSQIDMNFILCIACFKLNKNAKKSAVKTFAA